MVLDEDECQSKPNQLLTKNMSYWNGNLDRVNQIAYTDDWVSNYSFAGL